MTQTGHHDSAADESHHDPLHDIDGPKTAYAVLGTLALIVCLIIAMSHLYNLMVQVERQAKIGDVQPKELQAIRGEHRAELAGQIPERGTMTIDQAIEKYIENK